MQVKVLNASMTQVAFLRHATGAWKVFIFLFVRVNFQNLFGKLHLGYFFRQKLFYSVTDIDCFCAEERKEKKGLRILNTVQGELRSAPLK
jgi:hypothetical protein